MKKSGQRPPPARAAARPPAPEAPTGAAAPWVRLRSVPRGPFVYQRMLAAADRAARPGDVVAVYDKANVCVGRGLYNPRSQIAVRLLAHGDEEVDDHFWQRRIEQAVELRRRLNIAASSDAYRLVHAEGDGLSGLIAERYADCLVFEVFALGMFQRIALLSRLLRASLGAASSLDRPARGGGAWRVVVRADARVESLEGFRAPPPADVGRVTVREHGVRYRVDPTGGQKTGFFCDQRENRRRVAELSRGAAVLDLCCYSGGFGLCARVLGEAREVTCVDLDEAAVALARENAHLNQARLEVVQADAFAYLRQMRANARQYDVVVLDPPKLVLSRDDLDDGLRKYHDLNGLAMQATRPGGLFVTCTCSGLVSRAVFSETVARAARRVGRVVQVFDQSGAAPDHPVRLDCPESEYLSVLWTRIW